MQSTPTLTTPTTARLAELVARMPTPDPKLGILSNVDDEAVESAVSEMYRGGRGTVTGLVDILVEPGTKPTDSQARHALHALVMHAGRQGDDHRRSLAEALASTLGREGRPAEVRKFVVRQLLLCGGREAVKTLGPLLLDKDLHQDAAMALLAAREGAAEQFRAALPKAEGARRVTVIHGLGTLRDRESAGPLREAAAAAADRDARVVAWWALANIGDPAAADLLTEAADVSEGYERAQATKACLLLADNLAAAGREDAAAKIYRHLRDTHTDPSEQYVRDAASRGLTR